MPRLATRPRIGRRTRSCPLLDLLDRARRSFTERSRLTRDLILFGCALIIGLIGVPLAIWFVGNRMLGPYTHGTNTHAGPMALLGDFFNGLAHGEMSFWIVAIGPVLIILFVRIAWGLIKSNPPVKPTPRVEPTVAKDRL